MMRQRWYHRGWMGMQKAEKRMAKWLMRCCLSYTMLKVDRRNSQKMAICKGAYKNQA